MGRISLFFTVFHNSFDLRGCGYSTEPGRQAHTGSSRCGSIYLLVALPTAIAVGSLCACSLFFYAFPRLLPWARSVHAGYSFTLSPRLLPWARSVRAGYLCMLCPVSAGLAWFCSLFARVCSGLAQHHIECHHEAEAHHKCYGGAIGVTSL